MGCMIGDTGIIAIGAEITEKLKKMTSADSFLDQQNVQEQLSRKADLVNGKVPEEQLPDSYLGSIIEVADSFDTISESTTKRFIYVTADETNNGDTSLYLHNGTDLKFLQTVV